MCKPNATITAASRPFLYDFTVTRGSEPVPYRAFLHECCRYPQQRYAYGGGPRFLRCSSACRCAGMRCFARSATGAGWRDGSPNASRPVLPASFASARLGMVRAKGATHLPPFRIVVLTPPPAPVSSPMPATQRGILSPVTRSCPCRTPRGPWRGRPTGACRWRRSRAALRLRAGSGACEPSSLRALCSMPRRFHRAWAREYADV